MTVLERPRLAVTWREVAIAVGITSRRPGEGDGSILGVLRGVHPVLRLAAAWLNNDLCSERSQYLLCAGCSAVMYGYEPLLSDTSPPADELEAKRLNVALAVSLRRVVHPLWNAGAGAAVFDAAQAWLDCPCPTHAAAAGRVANDMACFSCAPVAKIARAIEDDAVSAESVAMDLASFCGHTPAWIVLDRLIDAYYSHTGKPADREAVSGAGCAPLALRLLHR